MEVENSPHLLFLHHNALLYLILCLVQTGVEAERGTEQPHRGGLQRPQQLAIQPAVLSIISRSNPIDLDSIINANLK